MIVCHTWHVASYGFDHKVLIDATEREARAEASLLADSKRGSCRAAAGTAIPLPDTIQVVNS